MPNQTIIIILFAFLLSIGFEKKGDHSMIDTGKQKKTSIAWTADWSYDDAFVAVGSDNGELAVYETKSWKKIKTWKHDSTTITRLEWNPKFPVLAVASVSHSRKSSVIQLYDAKKDNVIKILPDTLMGRGVSWNASGEEAAWVGSKGRITVFTKEGKHKKTLSFTHPNSVMDIDWHPTKDLLLVVEEDIFVIDMDRDIVTATYDDGSENKGILCCQWHPSGKFFVTGDYGHENEGGEPSYLKYWTAKGTMLTRIKESKFEFRNVRWRNDGKYLAATADVLLILNEK
jgi:WD40 repeat protein